MNKSIQSILVALALVACGGSEPEVESHSHHAEHHPEHAGGEESADMEAPVTLVAAMNPTEGNTVSGTVTFSEDGEQVRVDVALTGLEPGTSHGFHVHEVGDCSAPDGTSAGGHFNPGGHDHGLPDGEGHRHAGDMGNVDADESGAVNTTMHFDNLALDGETGIDGRSVIVHAGADDGGQPTGNAGARIACGVITAP